MITDADINNYESLAISGISSTLSPAKMLAWVARDRAHVAEIKELTMVNDNYDMLLPAAVAEIERLKQERNQAKVCNDNATIGLRAQYDSIVKILDAKRDEISGLKSMLRQSPHTQYEPPHLMAEISRLTAIIDGKHHGGDDVEDDHG